MRFPVRKGETVSVSAEVGTGAKAKGYDLRTRVYFKELSEPDDKFIAYSELVGDGTYTAPPVIPDRECFVIGLRFINGQYKSMQVPPRNPSRPPNPFLQRCAADADRDFSDLTIRAVLNPPDEFEEEFLNADIEQLLKLDMAEGA